MALTRPTLAQLTTGTSKISDPLTVLHAGYNSANVDIGFLLNRANGLVSNVALYWNESGNTFVTAFTSNTGITDTNVAVTSYANIVSGSHTVNGTLFASTVSAATIGNTGAAHTGSTLTLTSWANVAGPLVVTNNTAVQAIQVTGTSTKGGAGYHDFLFVNNQGGGTNPNKTFRLNSTGGIEIINSAYTSNLFTLSDAGDLTILGKVTGANVVTTNGVFWANGSSYSSGGGGGTPGGSTTQIQYNNAGAFAGAANFVYASGTGNVAISTTTTSTSTTTGALVVGGGIGVAGNVWAGQVYATNNGNGTNFAVGDDVWIGDINVANTTRLMGQQDNTQGYLVFGSSNATNYIGRSGTNPLTVTGAFNITGLTTVATVNAGTIGNIGANVVGTGTYLTALAGSNVNGTVTTANVSLYDSYTATTTNATFYPQLADKTAGNGSIFTASTLTHNPSTGILTATGFSGSGSSLTSLTAGNLSGTIPSAVLGNSTHYIGTTAITLNRASASQSLTGVSIDGSAGSATTAGTVTTAAQTNITSVGTLTGLTVSGAVVPNANVTVNLGGTSAYWNAFYSATATHNGITVGGQGILPAANVSVNIGSSSSWFNIFYGKSTQAQYADLAENYQADAQYEPGTVLVFGGDYEVTTTTTDHDERAAGVVSTDPAHLMNGGLSGTNVVALGLTGRVPCRVQGPVNKGTVLVTSTVPGVAQAIDNDKFRPGCVIGKALQSINTNSIDTIEVVVGRF